MNPDAQSDDREMATMAVAAATQEQPETEKSINYVKPDNPPQINIEHPLQESPPSVPLSVNGLSSRIVQFPGVNANNVAYVGTLIKKGKDLVPQKVLLTPVRSKDGAMRFILPKAVNKKMSPVRVNTSPTGVKVCPVQPGGFIVSQSPFKQSLGRSFVIQSTCGTTSVRSASLLKNSNHRSLLNNSARNDVKSPQLIPKPLPPATSPIVSPFPDTLPPAKTFEPKVTSDVTITSVSHPMSVISPVTPLTVSSTVSMEVPPLTPINLPNTMSSDQPRQIDEAVVELIPSHIGEEAKSNSINGFECPSRENSIDGDCEVTKSSEEYAADLNSSVSEELNESDVTPEKAEEVVDLISNEDETVPVQAVENESPDSKPPPEAEDNVSSSDTPSDPLLSSSPPSLPDSSASAKPPATSPLNVAVTSSSSVSIASSETSPCVTVSSETQTTPVQPPLRCPSDPEDLFLSFPGIEDFVSSSAPKAQPETDSSHNIKISLQKTTNPEPVKLLRPIPLLNSSSPQMATARQPFLQVKELSRDQILSERERSRKRKGFTMLKDCFKKTIAVKRLEPLAGAIDVDPLQVIDWDQESRIGRMPGSDIKFIMNIYGGLQVYECGNGNDANRKSNIIDNSPRLTRKDDIAKCIECQCYGLVAEFVDEKYCSVLCKDEFLTKKVLQKKRDQISSDDENLNKKRKLFDVTLHSKIFEQTNQRPEEQSEPKPEKASLVIDLDKEENIIDKINLPDISITITSKDETSSLPSPPPLTPIVCRPVKNEAKDTSLDEFPTIDLEEELEPSRPPSNCETVEKDKSKKIKPPLKMISKRCATDFSKFKSEEARKEKKLKLKESFVESLKVPAENIPKNVSPPVVNNLEFKFDSSTKSSDSEFSWNSYLKKTKSMPAWVRLFQNPFPSERNLFKVNQRLEAIDPQRQSLFCAVSVAQVKGYRLKLHFDGYPNIHDFWVNADSANIFPCGFCASHGIDLQPPVGYKKAFFSWAGYLNCIGAKAAPSKCFIHKQINSNIPNLFKVGMKLEAVDRKNSYLVCVATVAGVLDHRILIHFDSWDEVYDYWTEVSSPNIHPIGWCAENQHDLTPPNGYKKKAFSWSRYLEETGSEAAPERAFMPRPSYRFKKGTKLEAVDPRAPHLVRVATVKQVLPYQIQIVFDGFPEHFGGWFDDDCSDLHPVGWAARTGHPLSTPPRLDVMSPCPTGGCVGDGHINGSFFETHTQAAYCPYSLDNLEVDAAPDRLKHAEKKMLFNKASESNNRSNVGKRKKKEATEYPEVASRSSSVSDSQERQEPLEIPSRPPSVSDSQDRTESMEVPSGPPSVADSQDKSECSEGLSEPPSVSFSQEKSESSEMPSRLPSVNNSQEKCESVNESHESKTRWDGSSVDVPNCSVPGETKETSNILDTSDKARDDSLNKSTDTVKIKDEPLDMEDLVIDETTGKGSSMMDTDDEFTEHCDIFSWNEETVINHIQKVVGHVTDQFLDHKIDGEGFLMLTEDEITSTLNFSKADASRLTSSIFRFRSKFF